MKSQTKAIRAAIKNGDDTKVKVSFYKDVFTPEEFTSVFMAILETYTEGLLKTNSRDKIYQHFNNVFGIFLAKVMPEEEKRYKLNKPLKNFKALVDKTIGRPETEQDKQATEDNRLAAYLLARDILITDAHLDERSADFLLTKRLGLVDPIFHEKRETKKQPN